MRTWTLVAALVLLVGCPYVTRDEYDAYRDADGDGWGIDEDCAPDDERVFPFAPDVRGDGCDSDCGAEPDQDGDDWPDDADCDPLDDTVFPCSPHEIAGDAKDSDCDGDPDRTRTDPCPPEDPDFPEATGLYGDECPNPAGPSEAPEDGGQ